ncbi:unnamed protein product, partial [Rotaria sp. Silwood2]
MDRSLRQSLNNHAIIVLLIVTLAIQSIDIPWYIDFARHGSVFSQTPLVCLIWWLIDICFYNSMTVIFAWISLERHILIFYDQWLSTLKKRLFVHYLPLAIIIAYLVSFYFVAMLVIPCENEYVYTLPVCGNTPCYLLEPVIGIWDSGINGYLPNLIVIVANIALIVRVAVQKRRRRQGVQWRKHRRMIIQMLSIAGLYIPFSS